MGCRSGGGRREAVRGRAAAAHSHRSPRHRHRARYGQVLLSSLTTHANFAYGLVWEPKIPPGSWPFPRDRLPRGIVTRAKLHRHLEARAPGLGSPSHLFSPGLSLPTSTGRARLPRPRREGLAGRKQRSAASGVRPAPPPPSSTIRPRPPPLRPLASALCSRHSAV